MRSDYVAVYAGMIHPKPKTKWSSDEEVKQSLIPFDFFGKKSVRAGGMPIISDGKTGFVDTSDNHCIVYGASGFKKSLTCFLPLICTLAKAGENLIVTDPKGELYTRSAEYLRHFGYNVLVLNFRDYNAECFNPLHYPAKLYRAGETDMAATVSSELVRALAHEQICNGKVDPFWPQTAMWANNGILPLMYSSYPNLDSINFLSLSDYYTYQTAKLLNEWVNQETDISNAAMQNLRTILSEPDKTLQSTLATCSSFIQPFIQNDRLSRMLSRSSFDLEKLTEEKVALFIITDDASTICDPIVGMLISQLQSVLVNKAFHSQNGKLKTRVNFVLDEFCSFPVPGISTALATHRSRNIRYYLCVQSIDLLAMRYPNYRNMLTNCAASLFLGSTEMELLEMISNRCGTTEITLSGHEEPLISVPELMTLRKDWYSKEAIYLNLASGVRYCTTLPAIEKYEEFCQFGEAELPNVTHPSVKFYSFNNLLHDVSTGKTNKPFKPTLKSTRKRLECRSKSKEKEEELDKEIMKELEAKFDELFGSLENDEEGN